MWFNNVERIAGERIGRETVQYVSNIYKYYIAYTLTLEDWAATGKPDRRNGIIVGKDIMRRLIRTVRILAVGHARRRPPPPRKSSSPARIRTFRSA